MLKLVCWGWGCDIATKQARSRRLKQRSRLKNPRFLADRALTTLKEGDRYSKPTTHRHTDTGKTPATFCYSLPSSQAIADSAKP